MLSRFDSRRLVAVPLPDAAAAAPRRCALAERIVAACRLGAGPATRPHWAPWLPARIEWPYGVFHVAQADAARRACLLLDGSWALADAPGSAARLAVRGRALAADLAWWRPLAAHDAWDAGLAPQPSLLAGFRPRRATLIVVDGLALDRPALAALAALEAAAPQWRSAVRLVVAGGPVPAFARPLAA